MENLYLWNVGDDLVGDPEGGQVRGVAHLPPDLIGDGVPLVDVERDPFPQHQVHRGRVGESNHGLDDQVRTTFV